MDNLKHINITFNRGMVIKEKVVEDVQVGLENDKYLVLIDDSFTKLQKKSKKDYNLYTPLEHCRISDYSNDVTWERIMHFMSITLYTTKTLKVAERLINKELNKHIKSKCGGYSYGEEVKISLEDE